MPKARFAVLALLALVALFASPARSEDISRDETGGPRVKELSEQGVNAIHKGLAWLARKQEKSGGWKANVGYKLNEGYVVTKQEAEHPGVTALAGMAFLAGGHIPNRGKYARNVEAAVRYVLSCVNPDGMITHNESRMYSHAFGTLFLAEVYGMTRDSKLKSALERATEFTWKSQNQAGGWRYAPYAQDSDMSITVCQVMALRAARNIGIKVPRESIDKAVNYVIESANTRPYEDAGSFKYQYRKSSEIPTRNSFSLTAAGLATLYSAGLYTDQDIRDHIRKHGLKKFDSQPAPRIRQILQYLTNTYGTTQKNHYFWYYGNYYAVQAMFIAGGDVWRDYFALVQRDLVNRQNSDGSWPIQRVGTTFSTAAGCLILQIPYRYLPIFQR